MKGNKTDKEILKILLKDISIKPVITSLAKEIGLSRVGMWKALKKIEKDKLIILNQIGSGKTSICNISLNWNNPLVEKNLSLALSEDALKQRRWLINFSELESKVDFLIIYGSVIHSPEEAGDIDILGITSKRNFKEITEILNKIQKMQVKRIHALNFTQKELKLELEKPNKAFIDAVKKGVVLFGQERFIKFMRSISRK